MLGVRIIDSFIALIFGTYIRFLDLLFLNKLTIVLLALLPLSPITLLLLALNIFRANFSNDLIIFNKKINSATILLKS